MDKRQMEAKARIFANEICMACDKRYVVEHKCAKWKERYSNFLCGIESADEEIRQKAIDFIDDNTCNNMDLFGSPSMTSKHLETKEEFRKRFILHIS